jgi:hypothetical protein
LMTSSEEVSWMRCIVRQEHDSVSNLVLQQKKIDYKWLFCHIIMLNAVTNKSYERVESEFGELYQQLPTV